MADIDVPFGSGDTAPTVRRTLRVGGVPVDLTGATVTFLARKVTTSDESAAQIVISCTVVNTAPITPTDGVVDFDWTGETVPPGKEIAYTGQYKAVLQSGKVMHFPNVAPLLSVVVVGEP